MSTALQNLLPANTSRVGFMYQQRTPAGNDILQVAQDGDFVSFNILEFTAEWPVLLTLRTHGRLVQRAFRVFSGGIGETYFVTEFFLPERMLAAVLAEYE
jgi:hypothetical protein